MLLTGLSLGHENPCLCQELGGPHTMTLTVAPRPMLDQEPVGRAWGLETIFTRSLHVAATAAPFVFVIIRVVPGDWNMSPPHLPYNAKGGEVSPTLPTHFHHPLPPFVRLHNPKFCHDSPERAIEWLPHCLLCFVDLRRDRHGTRGGVRVAQHHRLRWDDVSQPAQFWGDHHLPLVHDGGAGPAILSPSSSRC